MDIRFKQWLEDNTKILLTKGIITDNIINDGQESDNPSTRVDHITDNCLGRITVWKSGDMVIEVLDIETCDTIMFKNYDLKGNNDFNDYLVEYFEILTNTNSDKEISNSK